MDDNLIFLKRMKFIEMLENPLKDVASPNYTSQEINWVENIRTWKEAKNEAINFMSKEDRLVFLAHDYDFCKGKPQLVHRTIQKINLLTIVEKKKVENKGGAVEFIKQFKFIDDYFDKRYDGKEIAKLCFDFWVYRLIEQGKEYYLLSREPLSEEYSEISGMKIELEDTSGIGENLKLNKISTLFIVKETKPAVKVIPKDQLVKFTKELAEKNGWDYKGFQDYIFTHNDGKIYDFSQDFNELRIAQFLSSKYEGYPLHILKIGPVGTGKTTEAETIDFKFKEELGILEAGTSRMKVLVPSFKEKPANLGYICNCNRVAIIDELMKMVANAMQNQHVDVNNYFGELNMLLEHKKRFVGSGNDNSTVVKATAKVCITTNPLKGKSNLAQHLSVLDNTTLSRMLIWVQDREEVERVYKKDNIRVNDNLCFHSREHIANPEESFSRGGVFYVYKDCDCVLGKRQDFLTIYDSCQTFLVNFNMEKVKNIFNKSVMETEDQMKQIWKSRGLHHTILILDGITKFRCLFKDYDESFTAKEEDYEKLEKILFHIVHTWNSNLENNFTDFY
ncbi:MAG: hypothetical protein NC935_02160 [Candidatus Omnitrophica bacterium]|nr:hypothetical protein [Candidatus Omnitrophota bacterium]